jgi:hypothetical protein
VVQLYLGRNQSIDEAVAPAYGAKQLKGFQKLHLKPGESVRVSMPVNMRAVSVWDVTAPTLDEKGSAIAGDGAWVASKGGYDVMVGPSSCNIQLRGVLVVA